MFDASASKDPDGGIVSYDWDFGDGTKASGIEVAHTYEKPGNYTAKLVVRDEADLPNSSASDEVAVTVNPAPAPAIAGPDVACVDEQATWQPGGTADPAGDSYKWTFGDGVTATAKEAGHAYKKPGWYSLALFADDGKGLANSKQESTKVVHVNQPPHAGSRSRPARLPGRHGRLRRLGVARSRRQDQALSLGFRRRHDARGRQGRACLSTSRGPTRSR